MDSRIVFCLVVLLAFSGCIAEQAQVTPISGQCELSAYFCPADDCRGAIITELDAATTSIQMTMFSLTDDAVGDALVRAAERGVEVRVLLELGQISKYSEAPKLVAAGISVRQDTNSGYMHNKYLVIDGSTVMTGSVNYSANGFDENNENLLIINNNPALAAWYSADFERIYREGIDWLG